MSIAALGQQRSDMSKSKPKVKSTVDLYLQLFASDGPMRAALLACSAALRLDDGIAIEVIRTVLPNERTIRQLLERIKVLGCVWTQRDEWWRFSEEVRVGFSDVLEQEWPKDLVVELRRRLAENADRVLLEVSDKGHRSRQVSLHAQFESAYQRMLIPNETDRGAEQFAEIWVAAGQTERQSVSFAVDYLSNELESRLGQLPPQVLFMRGMAAGSRGDHSNAEWNFRQVWERGKSGEIYAAAAQFLGQLSNERDLAESALRDSIDWHIDDESRGRAWHDLGDLLSRQTHRLPEAEYAYRQSLVLSRDTIHVAEVRHALDTMSSRQLTPPETRSAKIPLNDPKLRARQRNQIARRFRRTYENIFQEDILPPTGPFTPTLPELYVSDREWLASDFEKYPGEYPYEQLLDALFWTMHYKPTVFLVGDVGIGKSTLVDFYLRSYCPDRRSDDWKELLIVDIDFRNVSTLEDFDSVFYREFRIAIIRSFRMNRSGFDLISADNYAMWNARFDWESEHHKKAQEASHKSLLEYRAELVGIALAVIDDKTWVDYALRFISERLASRDTPSNTMPFKFVVLCLDNLDQSPLVVQAHAIAIVRRWLDRTFPVRIWQVYVPLRPESFSLIEHTVEPFPPHHVVHVGRPDIAKLLRARMRSAARLIASEEEGNIEQTAEREEAVPKLTKENCQAFMTEAFGAAKPSFVRLVERLAAGNIRRFLRLWEATLASVSLQRSFERSNFMGLPRMYAIGEYALRDGLITGHYAVHHRMDSIIANLFYAVRDPRTARDQLVGLYVLHVLSLDCGAENDVFEKLRPLGFSDIQVSTAIDYFRTKSICDIYEVDDEKLLDINEQILTAHIDLLSSPAYIDNMAMVTPVECHRLPQISITNGFEDDGFVERVRSTLAFLGQLRADEDEFVKTGRALSRFSDALAEIQVPCFFRQCALVYRERLLALRNRHYLPRIKEAEWEQLLNDRIFTLAGTSLPLLSVQ